MSSDSEIDGLERYEDAREGELYAKAGLNQAGHDDFEMSDEEVMALGSPSGAEEDDSDEGQEQYYEDARETLDEDENWGETRDNYFGGEDDLGEDEGASEEEEEEALRLQRKQLAEMEDGDFVDEDDLAGWKDQAAADELVIEDQAQIIDASSMTADERRDLIETRFPVISLLAHELEKCQKWEQEVLVETASDERMKELGTATVRTYMGMIYSFFALFSERVKQGNIKGLTELEEHPVHEAILTARQLWQDFDASRSKNTPSKRAVSATATEIQSSKEPEAEKAADMSFASATSSDAASDLADSDAALDSSDAGDAASDSARDSASYAESESASENEFDIARPGSKSKVKQLAAVGDYDETADTIEQQQRAKNKQSLRFYTSQIGKNDASKHVDTTGDMDVPYREREFERRQRLMKEAQKRGQEAKDVLGEDDDDFGADNDYMEDIDGASGPTSDRSTSAYDQVKKEREAAKEKRRKEFADAKEAARAGRVAEYLAENPNLDKRAINYQIEKNKGLTPKRKKENRNARVKKRVRYEAAQKKIKGVRRVYQEQQGPYQGELTGIRKNLVHSNKFKY